MVLVNVFTNFNKTKGWIFPAFRIFVRRAVAWAETVSLPASLNKIQAW